MDKFFAAAIENVVKSLDASKQDRSSSDPVAFGDVAPLLARINDANLALAIAKWLTRELHNGNTCVCVHERVCTCMCMCAYMCICTSVCVHDVCVCVCAWHAIFLRSPREQHVHPSP